MPTALVTGAAGFIGAHLVRRLVQRPELEVVALDDLSGGFRENVPSDVKFAQLSIVDHESLSSLFERYRFDYVYHLAAYAAEGLSHFIRRFNYSSNVVGSVNLINEAVKHDVKCFVFTSSIAVYGASQTPMHERLTPIPEDPYGIAKYAVELDLAAAHEMFGLNYVVFRPHNVYGEFQNISDPYRNVVGIFMNQILQDRPLTVFGDGQQQRAFSYVGDIIEPLGESAWTPSCWNSTFNIGADVPCTVKHLARVVAESLGIPDHPIQYLPARNEVRVAYSDHAAVKAAFGEQPQTSLADGISRMAAWVRQHGARATPRFENIEILKNLPPSWR